MRLAIIISIFLAYGCNDNKHKTIDKNESNTLTTESTPLKDSVKKNMLQIMNLNSYIGTSVGCLLGDPVFEKYKDFGFATGKPGLLSHLLLEYESNFYIEVYVDDYKYTTPFSKKHDWKLRDFRKERISRLIIRESNKILSVFGNVSG